jgi:uncharacterized membrane protein
MSVTQLPQTHRQAGNMKEQITSHDEHFEISLRTRYPAIWWGTLLGPFLLTGVILTVFWLVFGAKFVQKLVATAVATFFFFGRFVILGGQNSGLPDPKFFSSETLFLMVLYMDLMTAMLLAFHTNFVFKLPYLGSKLSGLVDDGRVILRSHPWMKRATFVAIVAFVTFPLAATGSIGGSIFGRLLGMSRLATFLGVATGSLIGCGMMYFGSELIRPLKQQYGEHPLFTWGGIAFVVAIILVLNHRYRQFKRHQLEAMRASEEADREPPVG